MFQLGLLMITEPIYYNYKSTNKLDYDLGKNYKLLFTFKKKLDGWDWYYNTERYSKKILSIGRKINC